MDRRQVAGLRPDAESFRTAAEAGKIEPSVGCRSEPADDMGTPDKLDAVCAISRQTANATGASNGHRQTATREFKRSEPARIDDAARQDVPSRPTIQEPPSIPTTPAATTEQSKKRTGFFRWLIGG